jgi:DNA-binding IscR family transcriptional regulator
MGQVRSVYRAVQNTIEERLKGVTLEQLATEGGVNLSQDDSQSDQVEDASV